MVSKLRLGLLAGLLVAVAAVIVAIALTNNDRSSATPALDPGHLLAVAATVTPDSHLFGAPVHVRLDAIVDRRRLDPNRLVLSATWFPYEPVAPLVRTRTDVGSITRLRWAVELHCVAVACAPNPGSASRIPLPMSTIRYEGTPKNGVTPQVVRVKWPPLNGFSRLDPTDLQHHAIVARGPQQFRLNAVLPPWRVNTLPLGADSYRISPQTLFWTATALALALIASAFLLARPWLPGFSRRRRHTPLSRLERALAAVERARGQPEEERKALELLADELRVSGRRRLAWTATELAWSRGAPPREQTTALAASVRRELDGRRNGQPA
jgi:hypothetical protein